MSITPIASSRVTQGMKSTALLGTLQIDQNSLLTLENQLSSGKRLSQASDDPAATVGIIRINTQITTSDQYSKNLDFANGSLSTADSTLTTLSNLVNQAQSIASSNAGSLTPASDRASQAQIVQSLINQALELANTKYQNESIFAGQNTKGPAFSSANEGYKYTGTPQGQAILSPGGSSLEYTLDGSGIFGGVASQVGGGAALSPALTASTKLSDLAGTTLGGVTGAPVSLTVGSTTVSVDLTTAATAGDVVNQLNAALTAAGSNASVAISGSSFAITGDTTQAITIADTQGGKVAAELGIAATVGTGGALTGPSVGPKVTSTTPLGALNNGAGVDPTGFIITNGSKTATISLAGLSTVQDLVNTINASGTNVTAQISTDGKGIEVQNNLSGSALNIGENGGTTATGLGIRSLNATTKLSVLNQGAGVNFASATQTGPMGSILIHKTDGSQFSVKLDGVSTPSQLISAINSATGNTTVTAALNATGNGITLTDTSGGGGNLTATGASDFSANGSQLGIFSPGTGGTLTGTNIAFSTDDLQVTRKDGTKFTVNLTGTSTIQDVLNKINSADGNTGANKVTASLNTTGNGIKLVDASSGPGALTVADLNGSTAADALGIHKTASSPPGTINGDDVNPVEPQGLFSSLIALKNALLNNDSAGITQAGTLLQTDSTTVITATAMVGAREQDIATRKTTLTSEQTQLTKSLSLLQDTDETSVITQFETLQTAYQAALQVAKTTQNLSLINFLT